VRFARRSRAEVEVNLTPLIDVVFLLLIFFMVSTTFTKETHISIDLPEADGDAVRLADKQIEISITRAGEFAINEVALIRHDLASLKSAIDKVSGGDTAMPMIITADAATPHQSVVTAMDAAGQLGFVQLSITTKNPVVEDEQ
jgi:biopolymer transport protein ExbD